MSSTVITPAQVTLFVTDVKAYITGERRMSKLAPFYAALVAEGYGTSNDDARKIADRFGAYEATGIDPDMPITAKFSDGSKAKTSHGLLLQRIAQGVRVSTETKSPTPSGKYVTAEGLKDSDRKAFLAKCAAEYDAANK